MDNRPHQGYSIDITFQVRHHRSMRTTLSLDDDAMRVIQAYSRANRLSLGKAASELIRRGVRYRLETRKRNGIPVFDVPDEFPTITAQQVKELLNEE